MNPGWRVLDFSSFEGKLSYKRGRVRVIDSGNNLVSEIALSQISIILVGTKVSISGAALAKFAEYDVSVQVLDWRGLPLAALTSISTHSRIAARQISQANLSKPKAKSAWASIVKQKILGQAHTLDLLNLRGSDQLKALAQSVLSSDSTMRESVAAKVYWRVIAGETDFIRVAGAQRDPFNSALDYGYTVLRGFGIRAITAAGLVGTLGLFHKNRSNPYCLVDDLMEPFRPMVDFLAYKSAFASGDFSKEIKHFLINGLSGAFDRDGRSVQVVFTDFAQQYGLYVENDIEKLLVPKWCLKYAE